MGFDILFRPRGKKPSARDFRRYFEDRPNYQPHKRGADYVREDTGCHFQFFLGEFRDDREPCALGKPSASFFLNYMRPFWFAHEAVPEIEEFVKHFDFEAELWDSAPDEQGPFVPDVFIQDWAEANWQAFRFHVKKDAEEYQPAGIDIGLNNLYPKKSSGRYGNGTASSPRCARTSMNSTSSCRA
jgi:hypothetical protein